ncbi:MAG: gliding motility lipoprotein GldJ [Flavobacteriaceae bacterium]|nr:gliding motility lipoprotein GldJ [Flavobacteriaceae bacterium]
MRNFMALKILVALAISLNLTSCKKGGSDKNSSRATGWKINAKEGGFQYNTNFKEQETPPGTVFVEGGTFTMGKVQDDVMHDWNNTPNQQHVQSFYMDETEVTNLMYLEYLDWIKRVFPPEEEQFRNIYNGVIPDTLVWRNRLGYNEVMTNNYLRHPAYREYPVVGVSWIQATEYANWRSDRVNEHVLEKEGYLKEDARYTDTNSSSIFSTEAYINNPSDSYGGNEEVLKGGKKTSKATDSTSGVFANRESGVLQPDFRLPTETEWEYAALGLVGIRSYNVYRGRKKYPWDGLYTRSGKRKIRGDQKANFKQGDGDYGGIAGWSDDGADITNAVKSYEPNDYGLYDMAGNVAEWVADVYRPIVDDAFSDFNYYRGNVYMKNKIGEDGKVVLVTEDSIQYDTLNDGKIIARNFPGEIIEVPVDENETYLRTNFNKSNHINYRDGDKASSRKFESFGDDDEIDGNDPDDSGKMYNAPKHSIEVDSASNSLLREYDKSEGMGRTSLINDEVRVYKGGSWKDRAYWLDPAQRRFYPQDKATDYIGFRCAMSRVGSKSKDRKKPRN